MGRERERERFVKIKTGSILIFSQNRKNLNQKAGNLIAIRAASKFESSKYVRGKSRRNVCVYIYILSIYNII